MAYATAAPVCAFSGYRPEKMPFAAEGPEDAPPELMDELETAIRTAHQKGCTVFLTGMCRGFDLWAAQAVLRLRGELPVKLMCLLPFSGQESRWDAQWRQLHAAVLRQADGAATLAACYRPGSFAARNRFMVDAARRLICYWDGRPGGTGETVRYARARGLTIVNLADRQLMLEL